MVEKIESIGFFIIIYLSINYLPLYLNNDSGAVFGYCYATQKTRKKKFFNIITFNLNPTKPKCLTLHHIQCRFLSSLRFQNKYCEEKKFFDKPTDPF